MIVFLENGRKKVTYVGYISLTFTKATKMGKEYYRKDDMSHPP